MELNQFWQLLTESQLVAPASLIEVRNQFESDPSNNNGSCTVPQLVEWLVKARLITEYQSTILSAGHPGPFVFGSYLIENRLDSELLLDSFLAIHRTTRHPVLLRFLPGKEKTDLEQWKQIESLAGRVGRAHSKNLVPVFESMVLPSHRLVVSGRPLGKSLSERLPRKARMPWKDACLIFAQIAKGLHAIHEQSIVHNAISPRTIWMDKGGLAQLRMALFPDIKFEKPDPNQKFSESRLDYTAPEALVETTVDEPILSRQSDLYALGCTLYRAIAGRVVFDEEDLPTKRRLHQSSTIADLAKYDLPEPLESLLVKLLAKKPEYRPENAAVVANALAQLAGGKIKVKPVPGISAELTPSLGNLVNSLNRWKPGATVGADARVTLDIDDPRPHDSSARPAEDRIQSALELAEKRKKAKWMVPIVLVTSLFILSGFVATAAYFANRTPTAKKVNSENPTDSTTPGNQANPDTPNNHTPDPTSIRLVQDLINDDRVSLWESPTDGNPLEYSYLPSAPKILFAIRPSLLMETAEGPRVIRSLGPRFNELLAEWQNKFGMELQDISRILITLHTNENLEYDFFYQVEIPEAAPHDRLLQLWRSPTAKQTESGQTYYIASDQSAFYLVPNTNSADHATRFLNGPPHLIEEVIAAKGITAWSGSMRRIAGWVDRDRHFSMGFLRPALFNDEGQWLMGQQLKQFNRGLNAMLETGIRGALFSFHIDQANYFEFTIDRVAELKSKDLKESFDKSIRAQRDAIARSFDDSPANPFWDQVRRRAPLMVADIYSNIRIDVEYGEVTGNCWLPAMAAHNLIAASELTTAFANGSSATPVATRTIPKTIEELMLLPRDLSVTTSPDMNILLDGIQNEVADDYGELPFEFNIRLLGNDLSKDGITKNQRPSDFHLKQTSLADIMTEIMVRCNPKKDITGPEDVECKLIWVLGEDPDSPGNTAILVTTRTAAKEKNYELPEAFKPKAPE